MQILLITVFAVAVLLLLAVPGYILVRKRVLPESSPTHFSKLLLYVSQPCLLVYTFKSTPFSVGKLIDMGIFALLVLGIHIIMLGGAYLILRKKYDNALYRIMTVATTFGNCAFFGIPILEALFPAEASGLIIYTTVYAFVMNVIGWTVGSAIISGNTKYITPKKIFLNPMMISFLVSMLLFVLEIPLTFNIYGTEFVLLMDVITISAKMSTPLSMIIMGMRLATMNIGESFKNPKIYLTVAVKQILMPLVAFAFALLLPVDEWLLRTFYIICACPVASVVLNYAELVGEGQKEGAGMLLMGTMLSIVTLPIMTLLISFI